MQTYVYGVQCLRLTCLWHYNTKAPWQVWVWSMAKDTCTDHGIEICMISKCSPPLTCIQDNRKSNKPTIWLRTINLISTRGKPSTARQWLCTACDVIFKILELQPAEYFGCGPRRYHATREMYYAAHAVDTALTDKLLNRILKKWNKTVKDFL